MKNDNWDWVFHVLGPQRHNKVLDVLNETADNDMPISEHRLFHCIKYDVLSTYWVGNDLSPVSINIFYIIVHLISLTILIKVISHLILVYVVSRIFVILFRIFGVSISKASFSCIFIIGDHVPKELELVLIAHRSTWQNIISWIKQYLSIRLIINLNFYSKEQYVLILIYVTGNITEPPAQIALRHLDSVYLKTFPLPILMQPREVGVIFFRFKLSTRVRARFYKIGH